MDAAVTERAKPYSVEITKSDGVRKVEFSRYADRPAAELAAAALRKHGIDARVVMGR